MKKDSPEMHSQQQQLPFGSWPSSITPTLVGSSSPKRFDSMINEGRIFWCETIASEKGRVGIMMHDGNECQCILPRPLSAKSKVHEYGGGAYTIDKTDAYFVLADDQRIYHIDFSQPACLPNVLTPEDNTRYSDLIVDTAGRQLIAVCEKHNEDDPHHVENYLVCIPTDASQKVSVLHQGHDFYSNPRLSPCGRYLSWLTWDHPDMPWDNTTLWLAEISAGKLSHTRVIAGNKNESIFQPQWSPEGDIFFVSDRNNWWNIFRITHDELTRDNIHPYCIFEHEAEYATPQWTFGMSTYGFLDAFTLFATYTKNGTWHLIKLHIQMDRTTQAEPITSDVSTIYNIHCDKHTACFIGASPTLSPTVFRWEERNNTFTAITEIGTPIATEELSLPQAMTFPTTNDAYAHLLFYPPHNIRYHDTNALPPLIVICHGGPTGATESQLNFKIQYWTNRGFAVADVNYRGSTGYGRKYRHALFGRWGIDDVNDVCAAVDFLADKQLVDGNRCVIKGSSAGGYTVLAALAFRDTFKAGVSLYGIGDLELLAQDTHKFEARYLDKLVGPYPQQADTYRVRSPIHFIDDINCPLLVFQGLQDKVVPPAQAEAMYQAVKAKGLPVAYVTYPEEAHGFRQAETVEHMLNCELQFYASLFGFEAKYSGPALTIENL